MKSIYLTLLNHEWKAATRSSVWHRKILVNLLLVLTFLYLAGNLLFVGVVLDDILMKIPVDGIDHRLFPEDWVLRKLNRYLLYYFLADIVLRYSVQKLPALSVGPYLHLPIKKNSLIRLMLGKSVFSSFNILQFLFFVPFMTEVFGNLNTLPALGWTSGIIGVVFAINFFTVYLKRSAEVNWKIFFVLVVSLLAIVFVHWMSWVDFASISATVFNALFLYPITALIPWALVLAGYLINYRFLKKNLYLSRISKSANAEVSYTGGGILSRYGIVGKLVENEFKFIWRNKRSRMTLIMATVFVAYGLIFVNMQRMDDDISFSPIYTYMFMGLFSTGMFILNYGQYLLGWDGAHFDHILSRRLSFENYYMSKFVTFALVTAALIILNLPYVYFGVDVLLPIIAVGLLNIGVIVHIVMWFGSFNPKKIDLNKSATMNWQGVGASQFLLVIPVMGFPLALFAIFSLFLTQTQSLYGMMIVGVLGLLTTKLWVGLLAKWLRNQRHEISQDFRNA